MSTTASPRGQLAGLLAGAMIGSDRAGNITPDKLLTTAAVCGLRMRAGLRGDARSQRIEPCPAETAPLASVGALAILDRLLAEPDAALLEEWATLACEKSVRVRESQAPMLLAWWARQTQRTPEVFRATGKRGEWLSGMNTEWHKPVAGNEITADADERWQTGTPAERAAVLTTVRRIDPARALAMVQATWKEDGAEERGRFLDVLAENRSLADEPFLESALDDKSKGVRIRAVFLLRTIEGSRLRARMTELAKSMISIESERKGILRRTSTTITVTPLREYDATWLRDGIEEQPFDKSTGKRAWWMIQVFAAADLSIWTDQDALSPAEVLAALGRSDFYEQTAKSMATAATTVPNTAWCEALATAFLKSDQAWPNLDLWSALPEAEREALLLRVTTHERFTQQEQWELLASNEGLWSPDYSARALAILAKNPPKKRVDNWAVVAYASRFSERLNPTPANLQMFESIIATTFPDELSNEVQRSLDRLRLRADMHKEFAA